MEKLPLEVLERILLSLDYEAFLSCKLVSKKFNNATNSISKRLKQFCKKEMLPFVLLEVKSKVYPHILNQSIDWKLILERWDYLKHFQDYSYQVTSRELFLKPSIYITLREAIAKLSLCHGMVLVQIVRSGCWSSTARLELLKSDLSDAEGESRIVLPKQSNEISLPCPKCGQWRYKMEEESDEVDENTFVEFLRDGTCRYLVKDGEKLIESTVNIPKFLSFVKIERAISYNAFSYVNISRGTGWEKFNIGRPISCTFRFANWILLGCCDGTLLIFYFPNFDFLDFSKAVWSHRFCEEPIFEIDVAETAEEFVIVCCSQASIFRCGFSRTKKVEKREMLATETCQDEKL